MRPQARARAQTATFQPGLIHTKASCIITAPDYRVRYLSCRPPVVMNFAQSSFYKYNSVAESVRMWPCIRKCRFIHYWPPREISLAPALDLRSLHLHSECLANSSPGSTEATPLIFNRDSGSPQYTSLCTRPLRIVICS